MNKIANTRNLLQLSWKNSYPNKNPKALLSRLSGWEDHHEANTANKSKQTPVATKAILAATASGKREMGKGGLATSQG